MIFKIISTIFYAAVGISSLIMGFLYSLKSKPMKYHHDAIGVTWESVQKPIQTIIMALMKMAGLGFLVVGSLISLSLIVFWGQALMYYSITFLGLLFWIPSLFVTIWVKKNTGAKPPTVGCLINIICLITDNSTLF